MVSVASKLGCTAETLRKWVRRTGRDGGAGPGFRSGEGERLKTLERKNRELRRANEILRKAAGPHLVRRSEGKLPYKRPFMQPMAQKHSKKQHLIFSRLPLEMFGLVDWMRTLVKHLLDVLDWGNLTRCTLSLH